MAVKILLQPGPPPADLARLSFDHVVGLQPSPLPVKIHHNLGLLAGGRTVLPERVLTALVVSLGVWAADKLVPRRQAEDAWTRYLEVSCPAPAWGEALMGLAGLLDFLTGDIWMVRARSARPWLPMVLRPETAWQPDCVCLFSGGLDSLTGAIDLLESGRRVLLVSHYDFGQLASCQNYLTEALKQAYGPDRVRRWGFRIQFEAPELSLRSRSLLFLTLGVAAASVWEEPVPVIVPENGWISLNPPLTGNRLGSYSTRTTHPYFLTGLRQWLASLGMGLSIENPYQYLTKGEVLRGCRRQSLLRQLVPFTLSCAHPVASRWLKGRQGNCGYCYPCLIRRAALEAVGWDNGGEYLVDVRQEPKVLASRTKGADLRSLLYLLETGRDGAALHRLLWQTGPLPVPAAAQRGLLAVLRRGLEEITAWWGSGKMCAGR